MDLFTEFLTINCCHDGCNISFAITRSFHTKRHQDKKFFYCPNGHRQYFLADTPEQQLQKKVTQLEQKVEYIRSCKKRLEYSRRHWKGEVTKLKKKGN